MTQGNEWDEVVETTGEFVRVSDLAGHLVIMFPIGYIPHIQTMNTRPDKPSDAICCDVIDLDVVGDDGQPGKLFRSNNFMQTKLILGLRPKIGGRVLGRVGQQPSTKPGRNPAWILASATQDPEAVARANAWLTAHPNYVPTEFVAPQQRQSQPPQSQPQSAQGYQAPATTYPGPQQPVMVPYQGASHPVMQQAVTQQVPPEYLIQGPPPEWAAPTLPQAFEQPPQAHIGARPAGNSVLDRLRASQGRGPELTPEEQAEQVRRFGF